MKTFLFDLTKCTGCYGCQIACKDEHCGQAWMPYAEAQPETGQFWMKVNQKERGHRPHLKVEYIPVPCQRCENAPCMAAAKDGAVYMRESDGMPIVDPIKAKGQKQIADACPYHVIFWNEELQIPQKCTGCAHLLDGDEPIKIPRCYDNCPTGAISYGEESELDLEGAVNLHPEYGTKPHVWYKGLIPTFVAGTVYDASVMEVAKDAICTLKGEGFEAETTTNHWGDFEFRGVPKGSFELTIAYDGRTVTQTVSTIDGDVGLDDIGIA